MEPEKSHSLPSVSWRPRKSSSIIQYKSEDLRTMGTNSINPSLKEGDEVRCPGSGDRQGKKGEFLVLLPFVLFRPSMNWMMFSNTEEGNLLY